MSWSPSSPRRRRIVWLPLVAAAVFAAFSYFRSERFVNPETGRAARVALSEGQEAALGLSTFREVLSKSEIVASGPEVDLVADVARRLAAVTGDAGAKFDWQVSVVRDPQVNAFCLPGGKIVIYTGIIPVAQSPAGLAAVMGHEMAHATSRHGSQRVLQGNLANIVMAGANAAAMMSDMDPHQKMAVMGALGAGAKFGVILPFSRDHEIEADEIGLLYMARAGYDPREAVSFWQRMAKAGGGRNPPEFASTHPAHETRIERLKALLPKAIAEYEQARKTSGR